MKISSFIIDNTKTLFYALIIAVFIRSLFIQPFYIPSSSMEPNLLVGDRLFVTKYSYGYSKHSFPFSPPILKNRIFKEFKKNSILGTLILSQEGVNGMLSGKEQNLNNIVNFLLQDFKN